MTHAYIPATFVHEATGVGGFRSCKEKRMENQVKLTAVIADAYSYKLAPERDLKSRSDGSLYLRGHGKGEFGGCRTAADNGFQ
jgi:hypothetical protein